ncbi:ACP S-malonyltransferase [Campylobacter troglodytis]|uniref:ACP S-malonyltransferase n=1 Tax=Campylobacter troglodytis TaxID=654363 RepID=UPI001159D9A6|nr:ACP S-malonyltransferase [Campylobacter troglodytis]TQR61513.1 [acyl-carrier-protein] S-malonyltransferase [Campylobacter troglodytis]
MKIGLIFGGQGSQRVGMGLEFYESSKEAKALLDSASEACKIDFKRLLFSENEDLARSEFTQPAIVLNSLMTYLFLRQEADIKGEFALGHSLGEFSALAVQGGFEFVKVLELVNLRGKFMQEDCQKVEAGMMVVLGLKDSVVEGLCEEAQKNEKQIYAANYNCEGQIVVAGLKPDLAEFEGKFKSAGAKRAMLLNMSVASHCPLLKNASTRLGELLESALNPSFAPVISNVNARSYTQKSEALNLLKEQLIKPVLYKQSILAVQDSVECFVELGSNVLTGLNKKITPKPSYAVSNLNEAREFLKALKT